MMTFEKFQNLARLYVIGALEVAEIREFEEARKQFGRQAEETIRECRALSEAFALSLRPVQSSDILKARLLSLVCARQRHDGSA